LDNIDDEEVRPYTLALQRHGALRVAGKALHPMRVVAQKTGLTPDVIRAWERRYRVVRPKRSDGGQRVYSDDDVERLRNLHRAVLAGRSIGQVARLDRDALAEIVAGDSSGTAPAINVPDEDATALAKAMEECRTAISALDAPALQRALRHAALRFSVPVLVDHLIAPLLHEIGEQWETGQLQPIHEHSASVEIERLLSWIVQSTPVNPDAPLLAVATPVGQQMELGALMVAASASAEGWRVAWFGPNLPAADILLGIRSLEPDAVALSLVHQTRDAELYKELERIARELEGKVPLLVGGRASPGYSLMLEREGAVVFAELGEFRKWLRRNAAIQ
jgi:DNA-binding transcriptional MerR regulator